MEKYGQFRDKGSGIAPFFAIAPPPTSPTLLPWYFFLACVRIPLLMLAWAIWLLLIQWLPAAGILRKANQWCLLGIPSVWWLDLQVDGVRRGSLAKGPAGRLPGPGTIIAASYTSPLDVLYLAAIFDPIFTIGQPSTRKVRHVSLEGALAACFDVTNPLDFGAAPKLVDLAQVTKQNPGRVVVVFLEGTTSNGRGILRPTAGLLSASSDTKIYPVSLKYTPSDIVTPIPGWIEVARFILRLNSAPSHTIRARIGGYTTLDSVETTSPGLGSPAAKPSSRGTPAKGGFESNYFDTLQQSPSLNQTGEESEADDYDRLTDRERRALDFVADSLARLGRVKRVGLGVDEKMEFVQTWAKKGKH